ncbi:unnamed protein product [Agarophyton chilense]
MPFDFLLIVFSALARVSFMTPRQQSEETKTPLDTALSILMALIGANFMHSHRQLKKKARHQDGKVDKEQLGENKGQKAVRIKISSKKAVSNPSVLECSTSLNAFLFSKQLNVATQRDTALEMVQILLAERRELLEENEKLSKENKELSSQLMGAKENECATLEKNLELQNALRQVSDEMAHLAEHRDYLSNELQASHKLCEEQNDGIDFLKMQTELLQDEVFRRGKLTNAAHRALEEQRNGFESKAEKSPVYVETDITPVNELNEITEFLTIEAEELKNVKDRDQNLYRQISATRQFCEDQIEEIDILRMQMQLWQDMAFRRDEMIRTGRDASIYLRSEICILKEEISSLKLKEQFVYEESQVLIEDTTEIITELRADLSLANQHNIFLIGMGDFYLQLACSLHDELHENEQNQKEFLERNPKLAFEVLTTLHNEALKRNKSNEMGVDCDE